jgi:NAD(P)-dependent dehydrogenase (short-subunit alcohol dehydrogenase family)
MSAEPARRPPVGSLAIVTGAASGIGRAVALRLSADGFHVICCDLAAGYESRNQPSGDEMATHAVALRRDGSAEFVHCDVRSEHDLERVASLARARELPLRAVIVNAGVFPAAKSILDDDLAHHRRIMSVNEEGAWLTCRMAARLLVEQARGGRIVFTGSIDGLIGEPDSASYCSSKGAVVSMARAAALDLAPYGITVNCVCPGCIETPLTKPLLDDPALRRELLAAHPLGRLGQPDDVAAAVAFLVSDDAGWITGVALPVDGGYTCR